MGVEKSPSVKKASPARGNSGFTLIELVVVITIVGVLFLAAIDKYLDLLVDVERTSMEQTLGILRSAVSLQMAGHIVRGEMAAAEAMAGTNPMNYLSELPKNYLGELDGPDPATIEEGWWYFDRQAGELVYRVSHHAWFETPQAGPVRARFRIDALLEQVAPAEPTRTAFVGLTLRPAESYRWLKQPN
ncbi:MAG: prepilin-type N-terminal cleavage/methylation domain-containing protein [Desulfuromonadales bacterium]|nr:prepilin-type N-terminal cleavage/methylation domain-containing protein [Desulfuromonadales bacterium]